MRMTWLSRTYLRNITRCSTVQLKSVSMHVALQDAYFPPDIIVMCHDIGALQGKSAKEKSEDPRPYRYTTLPSFLTK